MVELGTGWIFNANPKLWPGANHHLKGNKYMYMYFQQWGRFILSGI